MEIMNRFGHEIETEITYQSTENIQPYRKIPKLVSSNFLTCNNPRRLTYEHIPSCLKQGWKMDVLWIIYFLVGQSQRLTQFWAGWNFIFSSPTDHIHKIRCLSQINQSSTEHSELAVTLRRTLEIAAEAGKKAYLLHPT